MRWIKKVPKLGDTKVVNTFLWFPITINGETRWLERATVQMKYNEIVCIDYDGTYSVPNWECIKFLNN